MVYFCMLLRKINEFLRVLTQVNRLGLNTALCRWYEINHSAIPLLPQKHLSTQGSTKLPCFGFPFHAPHPAQPFPQAYYFLYGANQKPQ